MATKPGLYANIHAKRKRIQAGSGEKMRKPGAPGAPSKKDFIKSAKTAKKKIIMADKKWIQKATASIKRRGTEGKCTPITKPGCTGKAKALAMTFKKMAKARKGK